jgi:hypothetical protein
VLAFAPNFPLIPKIEDWTMINKIEIKGPATFRKLAVLETEKKVNLIYGLNGTGKSTICRFLRSQGDAEFAGCTVTQTPDAKVHIYNSDFVAENFHESDEIRGIFSLSKENKEAERKIDIARKAIAVLAEEKARSSAAIQQAQRNLGALTEKAQETAFQIKRNYAGGDRVLEFCLEGVKAQKERLFNHLVSVPLPEVEPAFSIDDLKGEASAVASPDAAPIAVLPDVTLATGEIEREPLLSEPIAECVNALRQRC